MINKLKKYLNNQNERDDFVIAALRQLSPGSRLLDAGAGSQRYRRYCDHLQYLTQDFGQYTCDERSGLAGDLGRRSGDTEAGKYKYGNLDYTGDVWNIQEKDAHFDAILCTEVFEHIPHPIATVKEFGRLLRPGGSLILTAPSNCIRHMDPYFYYSGFSDRFYQKILPDNGFTIQTLNPVGDYYRWLCVEMARTARSHSILAKLATAPAFLYYLSKRPTKLSVDTLCMGYHIVAVRTTGT